MKKYNVIVKMVSKQTHEVQMPARSATGAMVQVIRKMRPYDVHEMRVKEVPNGQN